MRKLLLTILLMLTAVMLTACAVETPEEVSELKEQIASLNTQLSEKQATITDLETQVDELEELLEEAKTPVQETENTTSIRPPLRIGETMYSHDFSFTPTEVGYTSILINGPFIGNTFYAFEPIEGYKFVYLKMIVQNQGIKRESPPMYGGDAEFKVKVDKGYIYQEINEIASLSWGDEERYVSQVGPDYKDPCSNRFIFDLNPEEQEELILAFEILEDTHPLEISFRLFASPEFVSEYGIETIIISLSF